MKNTHVVNCERWSQGLFLESIQIVLTSQIKNKLYIWTTFLTFFLRTWGPSFNLQGSGWAPSDQQLQQGKTNAQALYSFPTLQAEQEVLLQRKGIQDKFIFTEPIDLTKTKQQEPRKCLKCYWKREKLGAEGRKNMRPTASLQERIWDPAEHGTWISSWAFVGTKAVLARTFGKAM